jgi:alpha-methylacyl-CoA racemase
VADSAGGGLHAALAITAALLRRGATGEGQFLDVATTDGVLWLMSLFVDEYLATGVEVGPGANLLTGRYACYDLYPAGDGGWLAVGAIEGRFFANLCRELECEEWIPHQLDDDRQEEIRSAFRAAFAKKGRDEWVADLAAKDTCVAPVLSIAEVASDPHLRERKAFVQANHAEHGAFEQVGPVISGGVTVEEPASLPGADASDAGTLLLEAGLRHDEIEALVAAGVVS